MYGWVACEKRRYECRATSSSTCHACQAQYTLLTCERSPHSKPPNSSRMQFHSGRDEWRLNSRSGPFRNVCITRNRVDAAVNQVVAICQKARTRQIHEKKNASCDASFFRVTNINSSERSWTSSQWSHRLPRSLTRLNTDPQQPRHHPRMSRRSVSCP